MKNIIASLIENEIKGTKIKETKKGLSFVDKDGYRSKFYIDGKNVGLSCKVDGVNVVVELDKELFEKNIVINFKKVWNLILKNTETVYYGDELFIFLDEKSLNDL